MKKSRAGVEEQKQSSDASAAAGGDVFAQRQADVHGMQPADFRNLQNLQTLQNLKALQNQQQLLQNLPPGALSALTGIPPLALASLPNLLGQSDR